MKFIIKRLPDGAYVAKPGERSYTTRLQDARTWTSRAAADRECCGNERVVALEDEV